MPLDATEIAALDAASATGEVPEFLKPHLGNNWVMRSATQETDAVNTIKGNAIKERDLQLYTEFDNTVKESTGVAKNAGERATDYAKRAYSAITTELQTLKDKKPDGTQTATDRERIQTLEKALETEKNGFTEKEKGFKSQMLNYRVSGEMGAALAGIKATMKKTLVGEELADVIDARTNRFRNTYTAELVEDATDASKTFIQYRGSDGGVVNNKTTHKPATAVELLNELFAPYVEKQTQQVGAGAGKTAGAPTEPTTAEGYARPDDIKNRVALSDDLKKNGFKAGTKDFTELLIKYGEGLPLR